MIRIRRGALALAIAAGGATLSIAPSALAAGTGNTTNNCYGVYFNTDWNQNCGRTGATATGYYKSTADCSAQSDKSITKLRSKGSTTSYDGPDCSYEVRSVFTVFFT